MSKLPDFQPFAELDLEPIKVKLMHRESGEGWTRAQADAVEIEYRRFLYLMKRFPQEAAAPRMDVDLFWHYHILDTRKYAADCEQLFGYFLHHSPYIGLRGEDDLALHERMGQRMQDLYHITFGEPCMRSDAPALFAYCSFFESGERLPPPVPAPAAVEMQQVRPRLTPLQ